MIALSLLCEQKIESCRFEVAVINELWADAVAEERSHLLSPELVRKIDERAAEYEANLNQLSYDRGSNGNPESRVVVLVVHPVWYDPAFFPRANLQENRQNLRYIKRICC